MEDTAADGIHRVRKLIQVCFALSLAISSVRAKLPDPLKQQIAASAGDVDLIAKYILQGAGRHQTFDRLAYLSDEFGNRVTGSETLDRVIDFLENEMIRENFTYVKKEPVDVPIWVRGTEYAQLTSPRNQSLPILGLASSIGTAGDLEADVIVVTSFDDLAARSNESIIGKIVVYNQAWTGYDASVAYRRSGAREASKRGAVAALVRSVTDFSIASPHTGSQTYDENIRKIPVASITVEDAEMMYRMQLRNDTIRVRFFMDSRNENRSISYNIVGEIQGSEFPNQTVIVGGHTDSWDVGTGSMDDGGGVMISLQALSVIKKLGLTPRRTLRVVLWTAEEQGLLGGKEYFRAHQSENRSVSLIMENDSGTFKPRGIGFTGCGLALAIMEEVMSLLAAYNTTEVLNGAGSSSDTGDWVDAGVPGAELYSYDQKYFYYHHSHGDRMTVLNADDLDMSTVVWATAAYVVSNLDEMLPRTGEHPGYPPINGARAGGGGGSVGMPLAGAVVMAMYARLFQ